VNRSLDEMQIEVSLQAFNGAETAVLYEITGESYESINSVFEPDNIGCTKREIKVSASGKAGFEARPFSIYALEMK
jgi:alpha-N-arabinofuranosidase